MGFRYGAEGRTRTGDLLITNQLHYQLCYVGLERNYTVKDFFSAIFYNPKIGLLFSLLDG